MTFCEGMRVRLKLSGGKPGVSIGTLVGTYTPGGGHWRIAWDDGDHGWFGEYALLPADEPPATRPVRTDWKVGWTVRMTDYALQSCPNLVVRPTTATIAGVDVKGGVTVRFADGGCEETFYNVTSRVHVAMFFDVVPVEAALPSVYEMARAIGLAGSPGGSDLAVGALTAALVGEKPRWRCPCCGGETRELPRGRGYVCTAMHCSPDSNHYNEPWPATWWGPKGDTIIELAAEAGRRCMIHGSVVAEGNEPSQRALAARLAGERWPCPCCGDALTPDSCGAPSHPCVLGRQHGPAATATCPACHSPTEARPDGSFCAKCGCLTRFLRPAVEHKHRWIVRGAQRGRALSSLSAIGVCAVDGCDVSRDFLRVKHAGMGGPTVTCRYGCAVVARGRGLREGHVGRVEVGSIPVPGHPPAVLAQINVELAGAHYGCSACGAVYEKVLA